MELCAEALLYIRSVNYTLAMASSDPADAAFKARIIKHMNNDHADSLSLYLRHYFYMSPSAAFPARLEDISFSDLVIVDSSKMRSIVNIKPPMKSWADARPRMVAMDAECRAALGIPPPEHGAVSKSREKVKLERYLPPQTLLQRTIFLAALGTYFLIISRVLGHLGEGTFFYNHVASFWPLGRTAGQRAGNFLWTLDRVAVPMLLLHLGETVALERTRLQRYGVKRCCKLWWAWVGSTFVEGYGSWDRIAGEVERLRGKGVEGKHK